MKYYYRIEKILKDNIAQTKDDNNNDKYIVLKIVPI